MSPGCVILGLVVYALAGYGLFHWFRRRFPKLCERLKARTTDSRGQSWREWLSGRPHNSPPMSWYTDEGHSSQPLHESAPWTPSGRHDEPSAAETAGTGHDWTVFIQLDKRGNLITAQADTGESILLIDTGRSVVLDELGAPQRMRAALELGNEVHVKPLSGWPPTFLVWITERARR